jgi:transcriptional pleiotropic regulator of transition state genes
MTTVTSGLERKIDRLGRIVIPVEIRRRVGLGVGDYVDITVVEDSIVLTPRIERCATCGGPRVRR